MEFFCQILNGKLQTTRNIDQQFNDLKDGRYKVTIEKANKRSLPQNAYLHGVLIPMVFQGLRDAGWNDVRDKVDAKKVIKDLFLSFKIENKKTGEVMKLTKDTHELTTDEMNKFIEEVIQWAADYLLIQIPFPNEQSTFMYAI